MPHGACAQPSGRPLGRARGAVDRRRRDALRSSARAARRPSLGRWQVVVIEDADRLTEQAANALLKAVEEPPPRTVFLLCAPSTASGRRLGHAPLALPAGHAAHAAGRRGRGGARGRGRRRRRRRTWAAAVGQGHVGRSRRLAARRRRARRGAPRCCAIPASLTSLQACLDAADQLVARGRGRGGRAFGRARRRRDRGAADRAGRGRHRQGHCGDGARDGRRDQGSREAAEARGPPARSATRSTARSSTWRRSTATCCCARRRRRSPRPIPTSPTTSARSPSAVDPAGVLQRLDAVLACREALDLNVKPRIAVEAMTARPASAATG